VPSWFELHGARFRLGGVIGEDEVSFMEGAWSYPLVLSSLGMLFHGLVMLEGNVSIFVEAF